MLIITESRFLRYVLPSLNGTGVVPIAYLWYVRIFITQETFRITSSWWLQEYERCCHTGISKLVYWNKLWIHSKLRIYYLESSIRFNQLTPSEIFNGWLPYIEFKYSFYIHDVFAIDFWIFQNYQFVYKDILLTSNKINVPVNKLLGYQN